MRTGTSYMGHHRRRHIEEDIREMVDLGLDDVLVAAQENDFKYFTGKIEFTPPIARDHGLRPIAIFWGAMNLFGGGRSSQFLLEHPEALQVGKDGRPRSVGCYVNDAFVGRIKEMIDKIAELGFAGYFVDEPTPLRECYCGACREAFRGWGQGQGSDLLQAEEAVREQFRHHCVVEYVRTVADYCQAQHPDLETMCCLMPCDAAMWRAAAKIDSLKNLGTDIYWVNDSRPAEEMRPIVRELAGICTDNGKIHHEWLQCWGVTRGNEGRILEQGRILIEEQPAGLYVWAWHGQEGTNERCQDTEAAWAQTVQVFREAKGLQ